MQRQLVPQAPPPQFLDGSITPYGYEGADPTIPIVLRLIRLSIAATSAR